MAGHIAMTHRPPAHHTSDLYIRVVLQQKSSEA
jgi:hypothetical protein